VQYRAHVLFISRRARTRNRSGSLHKISLLCKGRSCLTSWFICGSRKIGAYELPPSINLNYCGYGVWTFETTILFIMSSASGPFNISLLLLWWNQEYFTLLLTDFISTNIYKQSNCYCSQANRLRQYTTVWRLMMIVWSTYVVAITSEEEKKNCCVDGPMIAFLIIHMQQEATPQ
jgi:hypothetical protein